MRSSRRATSYGAEPIVAGMPARRTDRRPTGEAPPSRRRWSSARNSVMRKAHRQWENDVMQPARHGPSTLR